MSNFAKAAIILAGGLGTRLRGVVPDVPKPMATVRGRPFLAHQMDWWIAQGIDHFVLSVGYKRHCIINYFGNTYRGVPVTYAIEEEPLGTGGGLLLAVKTMEQISLTSKKLGAPCLVINGDTFFEIEYGALLEFHRLRQSDWTFALVKTSETGRYMGMDVGEDGIIRSLAPRARGAENVVNGGIYLIEPAALVSANLPLHTRCSLEYDLLPAILKAGGRIHGKTFPGRFIDIGLPDDYLRASDILPR